MVSAPGGGARVVVRDGAGEEVFKGNLAVGQTRELKASPPVRVMSTDGAVTVSLAGGEARRSVSPASPVRARSSPAEPPATGAVNGEDRP